jgi:hypothetical protein
MRVLAVLEPQEIVGPEPIRELAASGAAVVFVVDADLAAALLATQVREDALPTPTEDRASSDTSEQLRRSTRSWLASRAARAAGARRDAPAASRAETEGA